MKKKLIIPGLLLIATFTCACKKQYYNGANSTIAYTYSDTSGTLKAASNLPIGMAIDYDFIANTYGDRNIVIREAGMVTFGYTMKHAAIVKNDGTLDFTRADALVSNANAAGLQVYGHTLAWYQNQNGTYLRSLVPGSAGNAIPNLLLNGDFESGSGSTFTNWSAYNGASSFNETKVAGEIHGGTRALKVVNATDNPGAQYKVQLVSDLFNTTVGKTYNVSFWIKSANAGGSVRFSTQPTAQYEGDQTTGTSWTQVTWPIVAKDAQTRVLIDIGLKANTYFLDDITVTDASLSTPLPADEVAAKVNTALQTFITEMVSHFKDKVHAWDVVNEPVKDDGSLRVGPYVAGTDASDTFYWGQYLGRGYIAKAFTYASQADPTALLFINDYNLEAGSAKVDSLIKIVNELKAANVPIHGIGTQMHSSINSSYNDIDNMFKKLAATGLKVRISELDVKLNPGNKVIDVSSSPTLYNLQAGMYKYIIQSYLKNVPAIQRYGVTIWGEIDKNSWIVTQQKLNDAPLLFDSNGKKKPAYGAVIQALKGQ